MNGTKSVKRQIFIYQLDERTGLRGLRVRGLRLYRVIDPMRREIPSIILLIIIPITHTNSQDVIPPVIAQLQRA